MEEKLMVGAAKKERKHVSALRALDSLRAQVHALSSLVDDIAGSPIPEDLPGKDISTASLAEFLSEVEEDVLGICDGLVTNIAKLKDLLF